MALLQTLDILADDDTGHIPPEGEWPDGISEIKETAGGKAGNKSRGRDLEDESPGRRSMGRLARHEILSADEEVDLVRRYQENNDMQAREKLILCHQRLVLKLAGMYAKRHGMAWFHDLVGEGNLGLMRALEKFELNKGKRLKTYASFWIKAFIRTFLRRNGHPVNLLTTRKKRKAFSNLSKTRARLSRELGREPTRAEIAEGIGVVTEEDVECAILAGTPARSLDQPARIAGEDDDRLLGDLIPGADEESVTGPIDSSRIQEAVRRAVAALPEREAEILRFRNGLDRNDTMTLKEVGKEVGVGRERVRQIEGSAYKRLAVGRMSRELKKHLE